MCASGPEARVQQLGACGARFGSCPTDVVEIAALRARAAQLAAVTAKHGVQLPRLGAVEAAAEHVVLCVRPERWLLLTRVATPGECARTWAETCAPSAAVVDLSSGLTALLLAGPASREVLARGCRLDLHVDVFRAGCAAATIMAQVSVILAALPAGLLLLTPSSTARHFCDWLASAAAPFGLDQTAALPFSSLCGDPVS
jgi:sarcosine oxidase, subunit gamma